ncbi:MAG: CdaR family protein [Acidobacteriota bacterium]
MNPTRELPLKLLALALAVVVWLRVTGEEKVPLEIPVPLEIQNLPEALTFAEEAPSSVRVRLRAPRAIIDRINPGDVDAKVDMSGAKLGGNFVPLTASDVRVPFGAEVVAISPASLRLTIERKVRKSVPVLPDVRGQVPDGYELKGVSVTPKEVEIEGAEDAVRVAIEAGTEVVLLTGRQAPFTERVNVDPKVNNVHLTDQRPVSVEIVIEEKGAERTVTGVKVTCQGASDVVLDPPEIAVLLGGPASLVGGITADAIGASVELHVPDEMRGPFVLTPAIALPDDLAGKVTVKRLRPPEIEVRRRAEETPEPARPARTPSKPGRK